MIPPTIKGLIKRIPLSRPLVWWLRGPPMDMVSKLHGMTSIEEQNYCRIYARSFYAGVGEIVDLGCFLGSTTIPLAQGLSKNTNGSTKNKRINAYDLFIWQESMNPYLAGCSRRYTPGESFFEEYKTRTSQYSKQVKIYPGDLQQIGWNGKNIEFLLIDAMKSWELAEYIVANFYGHLLPDKSLVLHQDFKHYYCSWIHLIQYRLRDYFAFEADIPNSGSVVFRLKKQIDCNFTWLKDLKSYSDREVDDVFKYSISLVGDPSNIAAAKVMYFIHLDRTAKAKQVLNGLIQQGYKLKDDLDTCQKILARR